MLKPIITLSRWQENSHPFDLSQTHIDLFILLFSQDRPSMILVKGF
jgi:hypothetical protein